jgi:antitoxin (DNA-binding transcriptional repressor) of toxin-antitoxin stability system
MTAEIGTGQLAELVKQVQAGHEVLLTDGNKTVARLVPALGEIVEPEAPFRIRSLRGHKVLTPVITQSDIAEDMFYR